MPQTLLRRPHPITVNWMPEKLYLEPAYLCFLLGCLDEHSLLLLGLVVPIALDILEQSAE